MPLSSVPQLQAAPRDHVGPADTRRIPYNRDARLRQHHFPNRDSTFIGFCCC